MGGQMTPGTYAHQARSGVQELSAGAANPHWLPITAHAQDANGL